MAEPIHGEREEHEARVLAHKIKDTPDLLHAHFGAMHATGELWVRHEHYEARGGYDPLDRLRAHERPEAGIVSVKVGGIDVALPLSYAEQWRVEYATMCGNLRRAINWERGTKEKQEAIRG